MSLKKEVESFLDHMRPFDGVLDSYNRAKYINDINRTNRTTGLSKSNYISDRNKINHSRGLQNVSAMKVRQDSNNLTNNFSSVDNNVKTHRSDNSHRSERHDRSVRHHRHHRGHRVHRIFSTHRS